jgi:hypothetical protein
MVEPVDQRMIVVEVQLSAQLLRRHLSAPSTGIDVVTLLKIDVLK